MNSDALEPFYSIDNADQSLVLNIQCADPRWSTWTTLEVATQRLLTAMVPLLPEPLSSSAANVRLCDDTEQAVLNQQFRQRDRATNVLSFPSGELTPGPDGIVQLGDISLAFETVLRESNESGIPLADHSTHLILHGLLHLLGYDHETEHEAAEMERLETDILTKIGLADPYADSDVLQK